MNNGQRIDLLEKTGKYTIKPSRSSKIKYNSY